jgi:alkanesulfonate monooxygenase SsuD/methylene tetrahydromethanopterin reductase-like flavin-dependent oxidoreductase (luciferase family)
MKFAVSLLQSQHGGQSERVIFRQAVEQTQLAEALGFHAVWLTEQHFNDYGICPDPLTFAAHLAGVTKTIRIGTGVVVLSIHNPLEIAERAALVDQLSGGRLDLGIGKGHPRQNYGVFNIQPEENEPRFYEAHEVLKRAWTEPEFSLDGQFFHAEKVRVVPRPVQSPHPPIWIATFGNPSVIHFAAQQGYPLLHTSGGSGLKQNLGIYRDEFAGPGAPMLSLVRMVYLCEDGEKAWADMQSPARWYVDNNPGRPEKILSYDLAVSEMLSKLGIIGTPQDCIASIRALREEHGIDYLMCVFGPGGVPHEEIMASMRLFAEKVMPEFAD